MGVIGGNLARMLCKTKNEVTVLARGTQREVLLRDGLVTRDYFKHSTHVDHPKVIDVLLAPDRYDVIFTVMQYGQIGTVLPDLAFNCSPLVVLVGNNMASAEMERYLHSSQRPKTVAFGFLGTGGARVDGHYTYVSAGRPSLHVGSTAANTLWQKTLRKVMAGTGCKLAFHTDMDAWYKSHLAFILPICYICYKYDCNLRRATPADLESVMDAALEGYHLLQHLGYPVDSADLDAFTKKRGSTRAMLKIMAKTELGELAASHHARNAAAELVALNSAFDALKAQAPDFPMPVWKVLELHMQKMA